MKSKILRNLTLIVLLLISGNRLFSQTDSKDFIPNSQIKFSLSALLYDNLEFEHFGYELIKSRSCFSGEAVISLYKHIYKSFGINLGLGLGLAPFNFIVDYDSYDDPSYTGNFDGIFLNKYDYLQFMYVFLVSIQKILPINKNFISSLSFEVGLKPNIILIYPYEIGSSISMETDPNGLTSIELFDFYLSNTDKRTRLSYFLKIGIINNTKRLNTWQFNLVMNYSPNKIGIGTYNFYHLPTESLGSIEQNINYIGLEFTYGLTLRKSK